LFGAPDFATFIKTSQTKQGKTYEAKVASMMKAGMIGSINNEQFADAAAFIKHGPGFSRAAGQLADISERTRALIDMLATPSNPYALFVMTAMPLLSQLLRNHEPDIQTAKTNWRARRMQRKNAKRQGLTIKSPRMKSFTIKLGKLRIPINIHVPSVKLNMIFSGFKASTSPPGILVNEVFSDPAVIRALQRMGVYPSAPEEETQHAED
jgi:hypothetical protein